MFEKKYIAIARSALQKSISYRVSYFSGFFSQLIFILFLFFLWQAVYTHRSDIVGFSWNDMKGYILIAFILNTNLFSEWTISRKILDGSVAMDLLKPVEFQKVTLAETCGTLVFEILVNLTVAILIIIGLFGIRFPSSPITWALFLFSIFNALLLKFCIIYISGLLSFWTSTVIGVMWARTAIVNLLSGALIPIVFFPNWLRYLVELLPFQGIVHTPTAIYLDKVDSLQAVVLIGVQLGWIILLWIVGKVIFWFALRRLTINGG